MIAWLMAYFQLFFSVSPATSQTNHHGYLSLRRFQSLPHRCFLLRVRRLFRLRLPFDLFWLAQIHLKSLLFIFRRRQLSLRVSSRMTLHGYPVLSKVLDLSLFLILIFLVLSPNSFVFLDRQIG